TDSQVSITTLTTSWLTAENNDWIVYENAEVTKATIAQMWMRKASTYLQKVKGHSGDEGNEEADHLANEGAIAEDDTFINVHIPRELRLSGVKLFTMTQSLAYQGILRVQRNQKDLEQRSTTINLDRICLGIQGCTGSLPTNSKIWNSTRSKKIQNKCTRNFLWKAAHDIHKCGKFWKHLNGLEHRAHCPECNTEETLEHILMEC
ncbi:hypothetical protein BDQ17DRAFT_1181855, partial [Cyathus striatus]